jgi:hypothetical protein
MISPAVDDWPHGTPRGQRAAGVGSLLKYTCGVRGSRAILWENDAREPRTPHFQQAVSRMVSRKRINQSAAVHTNSRIGWPCDRILWGRPEKSANSRC